MRPHTAFALAAVLFGLFFTFATPPNRAPDEPAHFFRAYQVSLGQFVPTRTDAGTGGDLPVSLFLMSDYIHQNQARVTDLPKLQDIALSPSERTFLRFDNTAINSPVMYIPQALGVLIGRLLELPPIHIMYLARAANLLAYIAVVYAAIRIAPYGKWAFVVIALLPMHIVLAASVSADAFSTAVLGLFIASIMFVCARQKMLTIAQWVAGFTLVATMSLIKMPLQVFLALILIVPWRVLGQLAWRRALALAAAVWVAAICFVSWATVISATTSSYGPPGSDPSAQAHYVARQPFDFLQTFWRTWTTDFTDERLQDYVVSLGGFEARLPLLAVYLYTGFLAIVLFAIRAPPTQIFAVGTKMYTGGLVAVCGLAISLLIYISWTAVGDPLIHGLQARYLTPLLFALIPIFARPLPRRLLSAKVQLGGAVAALVASAALTLRYFY